MPQSTCGSERDKIVKSSALGRFLPSAQVRPIWRRSISHFWVVSGSRRIPESRSRCRPRRLGALLAYLALHPGQAQARPKLAALLWGDRSEVQARESLRQALSLVRKALSHVDPRALIAYEDTISFEPTALTTDAIVFGDLVGRSGSKVWRRPSHSMAANFSRASRSPHPSSRAG